MGDKVKYIFIGMLLNSIVTSSHDSEEACKGREAVLKEKGVVGQCVKENSHINNFTTSGSYIQMCGNGICK